MRIRSALAASTFFLAVGLNSAGAQQTAHVPASAVDEVFHRFEGTHNPGCAVGVSQDGRPLLSRAYGIADLEHNVPITTETVFEPGSVSKQFTAAATILLALDGKLSLDDDVRKYIPELPDYGDPITARHLLNHTSGLRDWGRIAEIGGWPRTTREHTHKHMLDIASRQRSLNYRPGEYYSYTNTGYNLQAVLVERVSGMSFAEFSRVRLFEPLGMTRTEWRDDFRRIVKDRAVAYSPTRDGGFRMNMPFENVHGNGGLLTTVGDLLRFTHNLETGALGGPAFIGEMHRQGILNSGRQISYASGLSVGEYRGVREIQHGGSTAGYRAFLARYPDRGVAVAVMCNVTNAGAGQRAHEVADLYLGDAVMADGGGSVGIDEPAVEISVARLETLAGGYRMARNQTLLELTVSDGALQVSGVTLVPVSQTRFVSDTGVTVEFDTAATEARPNALLTNPNGDVLRLVPVPEFNPTAAELAEYAGTYRSAEAEVGYTLVVEDEALVVKDRYGDGWSLRPLYPDTFIGRSSLVGEFQGVRQMGTYVFRRDAGRVSEFSLIQSRVWDLRFERQR